MNAYEDTKIWSNSIGNTENTKHAVQLERLRNVYRSFWENAVFVSREIQRDLPSLTLHDDAHFNSLWALVDIISGDNINLTPLETFVLGGAILLHDNANCLAVFDGGIQGLRETAEWKDAYTEWCENNNYPTHETIPKEANSFVLFEVLRSIHAERAGTLADLEFNISGKTFHLIQDDIIRTHLGNIIGKIAASHHWDIGIIAERLPKFLGSLAGMPPEWTIRPILLACLLRCADATQLDQQRAPDFLYAMLNLRGVSELHWRAQNRLSKPVISPNDKNALIFNSTIPFGPKDSNSWWIAFDAIQVANKELQLANALLRDLALPTLAINRIEGALSPLALSHYLQVEGWRPVQAEVRISKIHKVVEMFGGEELYGNDISVPLRELIQNAADAIKFRRELEPKNSGYEGRIIIKFKKIEDDDDHIWLDIEDDGLGMSESVLTGPLIDFGSSYLSSALVKSERPGLISKGRKRLGKYGIGFFSCFMLTEQVYVTSRSFDKGMDTLRTLMFQDGLGHRPLLLDDRPSGIGSLTSTRVRLRLSNEKYTQLHSLHLGFYNTPSIRIETSELIGMLCPMLDVDVFLESNGELSKVHSREWFNEDRAEWLTRITAAKSRNDENLNSAIEEFKNHLRFIDPENPHFGLACISGAFSAGVSTVDTLRSQRDFKYFSDKFIGAIDHEPDGPKRNSGTPKADSLVSKWASEQAEIHFQKGTKLPTLLYISEKIADYGGDSTPIIMMKFNKEWSKLETILQCLIEFGNIYAPICFDSMRQDSLKITVVRERHTGFIDNYRPNELEYLIPVLEAGSDNGNLYAIPTPSNSADMGFYKIFERYSKSKGYRIQGEYIDKIEFAKYVGQDSPRDGLIKGKVISCSALKITIDKN
jgi:hypothetical protein